jgi:hypothetical protein
MSQAKLSNLQKLRLLFPKEQSPRFTYYHFSFFTFDKIIRGDQNQIETDGARGTCLLFTTVEENKARKA